MRMTNSYLRAFTVNRARPCKRFNLAQNALAFVRLPKHRVVFPVFLLTTQNLIEVPV